MIKRFEISPPGAVATQLLASVAPPAPWPPLVTVKASYQTIFWLIVSIHAGFWVLWVFFPEILGLWLPPMIEWSR